VSRLTALGWVARVSLREGLQNTQLAVFHNNTYR